MMEHYKHVPVVHVYRDYETREVDGELQGFFDPEPYAQVVRCDFCGQLLDDVYEVIEDDGGFFHLELREG